MSILWHRAGISHADQIGKDGACFFTIEVRPEYLTNLAQYAAIPADFIERNDPLIWQAKRLYREFRNWEAGSNLLAEGIILEMLAYAVKKQVLHEESPPVWLSRVAEKLNDEFTNNFTITELALEAGVHPVHLAAIFRQFYRESIGQYVQKLRIDHASKLLLSKNVSLSEVAYTSGFSDQSHFTRLFKRHYGMPPGKFRNSHQ
jgi:AraC family transcriptional regulator